MMLMRRGGVCLAPISPNSLHSRTSERWPSSRRMHGLFQFFFGFFENETLRDRNLPISTDCKTSRFSNLLTRDIEMAKTRAIPGSDIGRHSPAQRFSSDLASA